VAGLRNKHLCSKKSFWNLASEAQEWVEKQALQRVKSQSQSTAPSRHTFALLHRSHRICCWNSVCRGSLWHEHVHKRIGFHFDEGCRLLQHVFMCELTKHSVHVAIVHMLCCNVGTRLSVVRMSGRRRVHLDGGEHIVGTGCTFRCCCWFSPFCGSKALKNCFDELFCC